MPRSAQLSYLDVTELTPRQAQVLERIAAGMTNAEIAEDLGIGYESAKSHVSEILARLDVSTRQEAADLWRAKQVRTRRRISPASIFGWLASRAAILAGVLVFVAGISIAVYAASLRDNNGDGAASVTPEPSTTATVPATATVPLGSARP